MYTNKAFYPAVATSSPCLNPILSITASPASPRTQRQQQHRPAIPAKRKVRDVSPSPTHDAYSPALSPLHHRPNHPMLPSSLFPYVPNSTAKRHRRNNDTNSNYSATPLQDPSNILSEDIDCICGLPIDSGSSIACDVCSRWCHPVCFDIPPSGPFPEYFLCWVCRPFLFDEKETALDQKRIIEKAFLIRPISPSRAKANPFAYAQLNNLNGKIIKECPIGGGSFADVYMGYWHTGTTAIKVAIKELRSHIYGQENAPKLEKRLRREMRIWGNLDHPNIVSLLGVTSDFGKSIAMVCQWMSQGTLAEYLEKEKIDLSPQDRLDICIAVAHGISYLHSQKIVHGDLTPANILMNKDTAHLSDFGLSNVIDEFQGPSFFTSKVGGSARWIAPELLNASSLATSCDVYSFASIVFYVITGMLPYWHLKSDHAIIAEIFRSTDKFPARPAQSLLTDECWEILTMCWATDPAKRPEINDVTHRLQQLKFP